MAALAARQGGGGHVRAAGFTTDMSLAETLAWVVSEVGAALEAAGRQA
ncbi:MAG: hypothetical protein H5T84_08295 [Thermoleophilia bacterium]|nr:hypothetical protein [Thermoleophilia bacterium]